MHRSLRTLGALSLVALFTTTARAQASTRVSQQQTQEVGPPAPVELVGTPRPNSTPVPVNTKMSPMAAAMSASARDIRTSARAGTLVSPRTHAAIAAGASQAVVSVMMTPTAEADRQVRNALMISGQAEENAGSLVTHISHLLTDNDFDRVRDAQKHLNEFLNRSPSWYSENPPAEVLAIEAVLARMNATVETFRPSDRRRPDARAEKAKSATSNAKPRDK